VQQAKHLDVPITVCGELAGEPGGAVLLLAMGYRKLSMNNHNLLKVKWVIRNVSQKEAEKLLQRVLVLDNPKEVRSQINVYLETIGLGGLVRAGL